jgi:hypothetical protein
MPTLNLHFDSGPFANLGLFVQEGRFAVATRPPDCEAEEDLRLRLRGIRESLSLCLSSPNALLSRLLMNGIILTMTPDHDALPWQDLVHALTVYFAGDPRYPNDRGGLDVVYTLNSFLRGRRGTRKLLQRDLGRGTWKKS